MKLFQHKIPEVYLSIEVMINDEGRSYNYLKIQRKGDNIKIVDRRCDINIITEIVNKIETGTRVIITINGRGVLVKKIELKDQKIDKHVLLSKFFPHANEGDFIIDTLKVDEESMLASIIRKDVINEILNLFDKIKCFILKVTPGPLNISNILPLINISNPKLLIGDHKFLVLDDRINDYTLARYRKQEQMISIQGEVLNEKLIIAFAGFFSSITENTSQSDLPVILNSRRELKFYNYYKHGIYFLSIALFASLLINFLMFAKYSNDNELLEAEVDTYKELIVEVESLEKSINLKKELVSTAGILNKQILSYYLDQLAECLPEKIVLHDISVFPAEMDKRTKKLSFDAGVILVEGETNEPLLLNNWIYILKDKRWIRKIDILEFDHNKPEETGKFRFEISLSETMPGNNNKQ